MSKNYFLIFYYFCFLFFYQILFVLIIKFISNIFYFRIDVLNMKITGLQSRLDDNRSHEEMLIAKFNLLNKSIEDIKLGNELSKGYY